MSLKKITGRTHQIRAHLHAIGHGIVGEHSENYNKEEWIGKCQNIQSNHVF